MMTINEYVKTLAEDAIQDWAAGRIDEVMTDSLHEAVGAITKEEMVGANRSARRTAADVLVGMWM